jgi:hypothetical protein
MALNVSQMSPGAVADRRAPIVVELSDRRLPVRMRFRAMRNSIGIPRSGAGMLRRLMLVPATAILRLRSR